MFCDTVLLVTDEVGPLKICFHFDIFLWGTTPRWYQSSIADIFDHSDIPLARHIASFRNYVLLDASKSSLLINPFPCYRIPLLLRNNTTLYIDGYCSYSRCLFLLYASLVPFHSLYCFLDAPLVV